MGINVVANCFGVDGTFHHCVSLTWGTLRYFVIIKSLLIAHWHFA